MWSDNETPIDLLGFQHLVGAVTSIVRRPDLLPATIGVFGDWGSGKSSLLKMVSEQLSKDDKTLVLSFNGWLFEGFEDAKSALMGTILDEIAARKNLPEKAKERVARLLKRVNWFRVLGTGLKYTAAFALAIPVGLGLAAGADATAATLKAGEAVRDIKMDDAAKFFREESGQELRKAVREFRDEFDALLEETDIQTLVVVIDDLDRCLPETIIETLEAIKLFLFTPHTAFILGADERLVRYAVRKRFPELPGQNVEVGRDYLEKLIQFPIHIAPLDAGELETFINLLFVSTAGLKPEQCEQARQRAVCDEAAAFAGVRFGYGVAKELFDPVPPALTEGMDLAQRIAPVLTDRFSGNPRQCKRFLNTLVMRLEMAASRKLELKRHVLAKLMLLEYYKPEWFKRLAELQVAQEGRPAQLVALEKAAAQPPTSGGKADQPDGDASGGAAKGAPAASKDSGVPEELSAWIADTFLRAGLGQLDPHGAGGTFGVDRGHMDAVLARVRAPARGHRPAPVLLLLP
jgi:predicted KAP-like P-loop ATPase